MDNFPPYLNRVFLWELGFSRSVFQADQVLLALRVLGRNRTVYTSQGLQSCG